MLNSPLRRLRFIGLLEGTSYLVLLLIAMPLKYAAGMPLAVQVVGAIHGGLFILFVLSVAEVTIRRHWWSLWFWGAAALAAIVPLGRLCLTVGYGASNWSSRTNRLEALFTPSPFRCAF